MNPNLISALQYLQTIVEQRLERYFTKQKKRSSSTSFTLPALSLKEDQDPLARFVQYYQLSTEESLLLLIGLAPHVLPHFYDALIGKYLPEGGEFPAFGGTKAEHSRHTLPTGETALFMLAGDDIEKRLSLQFLLTSEHFFVQQKILYLDDVKNGEPTLSAKLILDQEYVELFTTGKVSIPTMSSSFPAQHISTGLEWEDLILNSQTMTMIRELENWVNHHSTLMTDWEMGRKLKPGYRTLFYGPPGTGKTLTATLLGKYTGKPVFKIDLSMLVSKYIGETEKNLAKLFDKAQHKDWILFFDEADAIFGKRTNVKDSHDKYANQEVSYLLQRIETFPGLTILASNYKNNIDQAFVRRFHSMIYFPTPDEQERLRLWDRAFPTQVTLAHNVDLSQVAKKYDLTGAGIMNVVQYCCISALAEKATTIDTRLLQLGIAREYAKEGKMM